MRKISPTQHHALLRVLRKALLHVRMFTGVSTRHDHDGEVTPEMWKAANAALNATHNIPDWLEDSASLPFNEELFVKSLHHTDHLFGLAGQQTNFFKSWEAALEEGAPE